MKVRSISRVARCWDCGYEWQVVGRGNIPHFCPECHLLSWSWKDEFPFGKETEEE